MTDEVTRKVADFLLSENAPVKPAIDKLDFYVEGFHVDPEGYREIGWKIRQGAVTVNQSQRSGHGAGAVYTAARDRISITGQLDLDNSVSDQATIIHEVTHALMDFHQYQASDIVQEVAAYVAGGLYGRLRLTSFNTTVAEEQAIFDAAQRIVMERVMISHSGTRLSMTFPDVTELANAIRGASSIYPNPDAVRPSDGISGGLINPWYLPRHRQ